MKITDYIGKSLLYLDGGMGTLLQSAGLEPGELPETWNITHPDIITAIHKDYLLAGTNVINTNTFGANILKMSESELEDVVRAAIECARRAISECEMEQPMWVALDVGPTGKMLKPYGDLDFEEAVEAFAKTVRLGVKYGADLIFIETMNDSYETKAALLAAKENSTLPVFVSCAYGEDGKLMTGASPAAMVAMLEGMGTDAIGVNCSLGPNALTGVVREYLKYASVPVIFKPNAGLPRSVDGKTVYDLSALGFANSVKELVEEGVLAVGGCCGTTPLYIKELVEATREVQPRPIEKKCDTMVSSYTHAVVFGTSPLLIGERINPTGKRRFKEALLSHDIDYILKEGITEEERGAHILDVNVGLPGIDEAAMLTEAVVELQSVLSLPLQLDTADAVAMEAALRRYNGKAMINSVSGKEESMRAVFPLCKKYGGVVVALTLDENGIPETAEGRLAIAKKILATAESYGIDKKDIVFDPLAMAVSADNTAAKETLRALRLIKDTLGVHTSLGVSNISFGLPSREDINGTFFSLALASGLSAAIMNPNSREMMKTYYAYRALMGLDNNCQDYISFVEREPRAESVAAAPERTASKTDEGASTLQKAIIKGLKEDAARLTRDLLKNASAMEIVEGDIIPALDVVGAGFEKKSVYLPQLLMSAEAAKSAFVVIKENMPKGKEVAGESIVIATVKGDIHDIGKNIVRLLLENYGFRVVDLGRDVPPEAICAEVVRLHAPILGLSALMTTTVPSMEETIRQIRAVAPWCKVVVGGAVLNEEYAEMIGADAYAKDAMSTVRYVEGVLRDSV